MIYKVITPSFEKEFKQYFRLRYEVLRKPWNQPEGSEIDEEEDRSFHFAIQDDAGNIKGVCRLQSVGNDIGQIRYMAVANDVQGKGLGKMLMAATEEKAIDEGMDTIILHARENAVPFYESCNYRIIETSYLLFDSIQHFLMKKQLM